MKKTSSLYALLPVLFLEMTCHVVTGAEDNCVSLPTGAISWWPGDGNGEDIIGGYNGTLVSGLGFEAGQVGEAFSIERAPYTRYLEVPDDPVWTLGTGAFTMELWAKFRRLDTGLPQPLIAHDEGGGVRNKWIFWYDPRPIPRGGLFFHVNSPAISPLDPVSYEWTPAADTWYHLALTRSGDAFTIYVDGLPRASSTASIDIPDAAAPLTIGRAEGYFSEAAIDEVTLYGRALGPAEIEAIYSAGSAGKCIRPDTTPPAIECPPYLEVPAGANDLAEIPDLTGLVLVTDDFDPSPVISQDPAAGEVVGLGEYLITVTATDASGNAISCTTRFVVLDSKPPAVQITSPPDGAITGVSGVLVTALVTDQSSTSVTSHPPGVVANFTTPPADAEVSGLVTITEGANIVSVNATDSVGNKGSDSVTVILDTIPPEIDISPAEDTVLGMSPVTLTVTVSDATPSTVIIGEETFLVAPGGDPLSLAVDLEEGLNNITVTATDAAGNTTTVERELILDLTSPVVTIDAPADGSFFGAGDSPIPITVTVDDLTGTAVESTVNSEPGGLSGNLPAGGGILAGTITPVEGLNVIEVSATDAAGTVGSASISLTLDTIAPALAILSPPGGLVIEDSHVELTVEVADASDTTVTFGSNSIEVPAGGGVVSGSVDLDQGPNSVAVTATDRVGNSNTATLALVINGPPVPEIVYEQLSSTGDQANVRLDGSGTTDPGDPLSSLSFEWILDGSVLDLVDPIIEISLDFGPHTVTLRVTDPLGAVGEVTKTLTLDAATLSSLNIDETRVWWGPGFIQLRGEIGLPPGINFTELAPVAGVSLNLAGYLPRVLPETAVAFGVRGRDGSYWNFYDCASGAAIRKFDIDWKGTRYHYKKWGMPIELKSRMITSSETVLTLKINRWRIHAPFAMDFDGLARVNVDAHGGVTAESPAVVEVERCGREVTLILPFPLLPTSVITLSGSLNATILVADDLKESVGRFQMTIRFDASVFPDGAATLPRTLDLDLLVGTQGHGAGTSLGSDDLKVEWNTWRQRKGRCGKPKLLPIFWKNPAVWWNWICQGW